MENRKPTDSVSVNWFAVVHPVTVTCFVRLDARVVVYPGVTLGNWCVIWRGFVMLWCMSVCSVVMLCGGACSCRCVITAVIEWALVVLVSVC